MSDLSKNQNIHIIGQGLVGSLLAWRLMEEGYSPLVFDKGHATASSMVAAGMWNPVNFKRLNVGQHPEQYLAAMHSTYPRLEHWLGASFFKALPIARVFDSQEEINQWDIQSALGKLSARYLTQTDYAATHPAVRRPLGAGLVAEGGRVDLPTLLEAMRRKLEERGALVSSHYSSNETDALVIHCTGMSIVQDPLWHWLPMAPNKGQVLTVRINDFDPTQIYHFGRFVVPLHHDTYKLGSTYELRPTDTTPDPNVAQEMLNDYSATIDRPCEVVEHRAGYRPTTYDRMPIVGPHPQNPKQYVCNGFGSRGVYYAPLCIEHLVDHLLHGTALPKDISIARTHKFFPSTPDTSV